MSEDSVTIISVSLFFRGTNSKGKKRGHVFKEPFLASSTHLMMVFTCATDALKMSASRDFFRSPLLEKSWLICSRSSQSHFQMCL